MNVLYLSPFFYPEKISTGKYNTYLVEALKNNGCDVTVITSHPIYPNWIVQLSNATLPGISIKRGGALIVYPKNVGLRRAILELWYAMYVLLRYFKLESTPDIIISVFPPSLYFMFLQRFISPVVSKIGIVHDLQGVYSSIHSSCLARIISKSISLVEKKCFNSCDNLIFLSKSMKKHAVMMYDLNKNKCKVCYPFITNSNEMQNGTALADILLPLKYNVVYSGALGDKQNPYELFAFMNKIAFSYPEIMCHIFSDGPIYESLIKSYQGKENCNVHFHNLVSELQLAELYERSDIQIIPQLLHTSEGSLPSKLPNIIAAGVSLFVISDAGSELEDFVISSNAGVVSNTWNIDELESLFLSFMGNIFKESKSDRKIRLSQFAKSKFNIDFVVEEILLLAKSPGHH